MKNLSLLLLLTLPAAAQTLRLGALPGGGSVEFRKTGVTWGIFVKTTGQNAASQPRPLHLEFFQGDSINFPTKAVGYQTVRKTADGAVATARFAEGPVRVDAEDAWSLDGGTLRLSRNLTVRVAADARLPYRGFLSGVTLELEKSVTRQQAQAFAPGMIYGGTDFLTSVAIGGAAHQRHLRIREDRLPAPLFGLRLSDGTTLAALDPTPDGSTSPADANDTKVQTLVDEAVRVGAIGVNFAEKSGLGFWFPGTEGEVTYTGNTYPGGQVHRWRRRYHPLKDGFTQAYRVDFKFGKSPSLPDFYTQTWRWAWQTLQPKVVPHDLKTAREILVKQLAGEIFRYPGGMVGISNFAEAPASKPLYRDFKSIMGFTGKALESAEHVLLDQQLHPAPWPDSVRKNAIELFDTFADKLTLSPPLGEGFDLRTGNFSQALFVQKVNEVFLRSFTDDLKATLRAYRREKAAGFDHPNWLAWARSFADWLLPQQAAEGGFPRTWTYGKPTVEVSDKSPAASYNAVPFLALLSQLAGERKYLDAALRAAEFCWKRQQGGVFAGGTIDNPDVIDKEAGTLSLEAYLTLFEVTKDKKWLDRAQAAANFAETWMFIWNVPMPVAADNAQLHWKRGVSTVGAQLIASGHSLTDNYMTFDVDEFAHLYKLTGDAHYRDVARLLLHNTKGMVALPAHPHDLRALGWSQEHFSFAPWRGYGLHRGWLPWVTTSHLNGMLGLEELDKKLFEELAQP